MRPGLCPTRLPRAGARVAVALVAAAAWAWPAAAAASSGSPDPASASAWRWPVDRPVKVLRGFEPPSGPYAAGHRGVDLRAAPGTVTRSAGAGTVVLAGSVAGRPVVVVAHGAARTDDELRTTYEPVVAKVSLGTRVRPGSELGRVGTWVGHCEPRGCLHWGLRRGNAYLDPLSLLRGPVRLLAVGGPVDAAAAPPSTARDGRAALVAAPSVPPHDPTRRTRSVAPLGAVGPVGAGAAVVAGGALGVRRARARRTAPAPARRGSSP